MEEVGKKEDEPHGAHFAGFTPWASSKPPCLGLITPDPSDPTPTN